MPSETEPAIDHRALKIFISLTHVTIIFKYREMKNFHTVKNTYESIEAKK